MAFLAAGSLPWILWVVAAAAGTLGFGMRMESRPVQLASLPFWLVLLGFLWFFRDPERQTAEGIVCPADGRITDITEVEDPDVGKATRISIFMSPLDVHVNRFPVDGQITRMAHYPGKHVPAFNKDSDRNERVETVLDAAGVTIKVVQITGAVARRIVPYCSPGDEARRGDRMGLIRLGSRCDLYLPANRADWQADVGDRVHAGSTTIARWRDP